MHPFALTTSRLVLNELTSRDVDAIAAYCTEPVFEHYMSTPWPYQRSDAEWFVAEGAPEGWSDDSEWTWAIRRTDGGPLIGTICVRLHSGSIGYWLGAEHRGDGIMSEAVNAVVAATFERTELPNLRWECVIGNTASMRVAQRSGFTYTGEAPGETLSRSGGVVDSWTAVIQRGDTVIQSDGWPA